MKIKPSDKGQPVISEFGHPPFLVSYTSNFIHAIFGDCHTSCKFWPPYDKNISQISTIWGFSTLLGVKIILLDFFLFETLFLYQIPLIWCTTWVYSAGLNIFIKRGLGCKLAPQKKGSQSYLSMLFLHFLFSIPQRSFMPNLVLVKWLAVFFFNS